MKNSDLISKRFLSISIGISLILISASLFIFSLKNVNASKAETPPPAKNEQYSVYPVGISGGYAYYIWTGDNWTFEKMPIEKAKDATWVK
jgi:hypothetical protein